MLSLLQRVGYWFPTTYRRQLLPSDIDTAVRSPQNGEVGSFVSLEIITPHRTKPFYMIRVIACWSVKLSCLLFSVYTAAQNDYWHSSHQFTRARRHAGWCNRVLRKYSRSGTNSSSTFTSRQNRLVSHIGVTEKTSNWKVKRLMIKIG